MPMLVTGPGGQQVHPIGEGQALTHQAHLASHTVRLGSSSSIGAVENILKAVGRFFSGVFSRQVHASSEGQPAKKAWTKRSIVKAAGIGLCTVGLVVVGLKMSALLIPGALFAAGLYFSLHMI